MAVVPSAPKTEPHGYQDPEYPTYIEPTPAPDMVNHPPHYSAANQPSGVEVITITRHMGFNLGNVVKYVLRCDLKGKEIEDLEKAAWYLADEIAKRRKKAADIAPGAYQVPVSDLAYASCPDCGASGSASSRDGRDLGTCSTCDGHGVAKS